MATTDELKQQLHHHADKAIRDAVAFLQEPEQQDALDAICGTVELVATGTLSAFTIGSVDAPTVYAAMTLAAAVVGKQLGDELAQLSNELAGEIDAAQQEDPTHG